MSQWHIHCRFAEPV